MAEIDKSIIIYKTCEVLPVYNFMQIINTDNLSWLIKGYDEFGAKEDYVYKENLTSFWNRIIEEYLDLKKDKKVIQSYNARIIINRLEDGLNTCKMLLGLCTIDIGLVNIIKISEALSIHNKKYEIDLNKPLEEEKKRIGKLFKRAQFNIDIKKSNFEKDFSSKEEQSKLDIYQEMANLEQALKRNEINPKTTVVAKWIALCNLATKQNG